MNESKTENLPVTDPQGTDADMLDKLQRETFDYFLNEVNPVTGLVADKTEPGFPSSIAVTGMAITAYIIGVEKKFLSRKNAIERVLKILRFFYDSQQGKQATATGYKGFYYHFLKMNNGERVENPRVLPPFPHAHLNVKMNGDWGSALPVFPVLANIAEMERQAIRERQLEGIQIAKLKGTYKGREKGTTETKEEVLKKYQLVVKHLSKINYTYREVAKLSDCSKNTVIKVKKLLETA